MQGVANPGVPLTQRLVNPLGVLEAVISLGVNGVDGLPWRQDEDLRMELEPGD